LAVGDEYVSAGGQSEIVQEMLARRSVEDVPRAERAGRKIEGEERRGAGRPPLPTVGRRSGPEDASLRVHLEAENGPEAVPAARDEVLRGAVRSEADDLPLRETPDVEVLRD